MLLFLLCIFVVAVPLFLSAPALRVLLELLLYGNGNRAAIRCSRQASE